MRIYCKKWISNTVLIGFFPLILNIYASHSFAAQRTESQLAQTPKSEKLLSKEQDLVRGEVLYKQAKELLYYPISGREPLADKKIQARHLLEESYRLGYKKAAGALGFSLIYAPELIYDHTYPNPDLDYIFRLFEEGRALKDTESIRGLAFMYREGRSVPRDDKKMIELYKEAAALGDNQAQYLLGAFYSGQSILFYYLIQPDREPFKEIDKEKGLYWLKTAAENGNLRAWEMLAKYYDREEPNPKLQEYYLREGAKRGNKNLLISLSLLYGNEEFFPIDDLSNADRKRLDACIDHLYDISKPLDDKPILDFDKTCPRKIQSIE